MDFRWQHLDEARETGGLELGLEFAGGHGKEERELLNGCRWSRQKPRRLQASIAPWFPSFPVEKHARKSAFCRAQGGVFPPRNDAVKTMIAQVIRNLPRARAQDRHLRTGPERLPRLRAIPRRARHRKHHAQSRHRAQDDAGDRGEGECAFRQTVTAPCSRRIKRGKTQRPLRTS